MKILKIDSTVTVITDDGQVITSSNCSEELFKEIYAYVQKGDVDAVKQLLVPELCAEEKTFLVKKTMVETIHTMASKYSNLFTVQGSALYRNGINLSVPEELALSYVEAYQDYLENPEEGYPISNFQDNEDFIALDRFWMWCSLNPNAESREDLFRFLKHHEMQITNQGMFLAYRRVVSKNAQNKGLVGFVSSNYVKVKANWKKNPIHYTVYEKDGIYELFHVTNDTPSEDYTYDAIGNLQDLYLNLPTMQEDQFTDAHTHTMDYRIGVAGILYIYPSIGSCCLTNEVLVHRFDRSRVYGINIVVIACKIPLP